MAPKRFRSLRLKDLRLELEGVERWLRDLRHNRGRWPREWCKGMIRYYDDRRMELRAKIRSLSRDAPVKVKPKRER